MAVDLIKAIAELLGAIAWPLTVAVVALVVLGRHRHAVDRLIDRIRSLSALGSQVDLDALSHQEQEVENKIEYVSDVSDDREALRAAVQEVAEAARVLGALEALQRNARLYSRNLDDDPRGPWMSSDITSAMDRPNLRYEVTSPSGTVFTPPKGRSWKYSRERFKELDEDGRIYWGPEGRSRPTLKRFASERRS